MTLFPDGLERLAHATASLLWDRAVSAAVAVVVVAALWMVLRRRLSASAGALLFLAAFSPLVLPVERLLPDRLAAVSPQTPLRDLFDSVARDPFVVAGPTVAIDPLTDGAVPVRTRAAATAGSPDRLEVCWVTVAFCAWAAAVLVWLVRFLVAQARTARAIRQGDDLGDHPVGVLAERLAMRMGVSRPVRVIRTASVASPATWGVRRPVVLMPAGLVAELSTRQIGWVLLHELAHVRRGDVAVQVVQRLVQILYCFHPLVWIVGPVIDQLREYACDDLAIASGRRTRRHCAEGFLRVVERASTGMAAAAPGAALFRDATFLERRLQRMVDERRAVRVGISRSALALVVGVLCFALPASSRPAPIPAGSPQRAAIGEGLSWLVRTQRDDGRWSAGEFGDRAPQAERNVLNDAGVTGLAVLALLGDRDDDPARRRAATRGVRWILDAQDPETGQIAAAPSITQVYNHGYATLALARAARAVSDPLLTRGLQAAVEHIARTHSRGRGWRYQSPAEGECDSSVTGLMLLALSAARVAGADVPEHVMAEGVAFLHDMTDADTGRTGYRRPGQPNDHAAPAALPPRTGTWTEALTALAVTVRVHLDDGEGPGEAVRRSAARLVARLPVWADGAVDFYYWFCGTMAMGMAGGDAFEAWCGALSDVLPRHQRADGSWPAVDAWSHLGGDVYATAMCVLSLQESLASP